MQRFKRYIALAFTLLYLIFSGGIPRSMHFCEGELTTEALFAYENEGCCCEIHHPEWGDCCTDKQELEKVQDEHSIGAKQLTSKKLAFYCLPFVLHTTQACFKTELELPAKSFYALAYKLKRPPPDAQKKRLALLGCLRISEDELG